MSVYGLCRHKTGAERAINTDRFYGMDSGSIKRGSLLDCSGVTVLSGGALKSLLAADKIEIADSKPLAGVYTYSKYYDPEYETHTTAKWVYENVCPESVLAYPAMYTVASRILIADVGMAGKSGGGYRNILAAYNDGCRILVLYEAVFNMIDQRRIDEVSAKGSGYVVEFDSSGTEEPEACAKIYTLRQTWLDVIENGKIESSLVDASLELHKTLHESYGKSLLLSLDGDNYKYVSTDYAPFIGASYTILEDRVYKEIYPSLAESYPAGSYIGREKHIVRYSNRENGGAPFGDSGEKLLLLPDMRLIVCDGGVWSLSGKSDSMPTLGRAVQHFERLFGIYGDRLYVSCAGDCTDFSEGVDNLPPTAGWQTVTSDGDFTAIASFDGRVAVFTERNMMTVRGTDLPFSLTLEGAYGCRRQSSLAVLDGGLYFASQNGIMRYNGSSIECIDGLPCGVDYADALLTESDGMLVIKLAEYEEPYVYNPISRSITQISLAAFDATLPDGDGGCIFTSSGGAFFPQKLFEKDGDFSFSLSLGANERMRICEVGITARVGHTSRLALVGEDGNALLTLEDTEGDTVTRSVRLFGRYADLCRLRFTGKGDVTLYCVRATYRPKNNRTRHIK